MRRASPLRLCMPRKGPAARDEFRSHARISLGGDEPLDRRFECRDGALFRRRSFCRPLGLPTSGGSVFLRFVSPSRLENQKLTLLMLRVCLAKPGTCVLRFR